MLRIAFSLVISSIYLIRLGNCGKINIKIGALIDYNQEANKNIFKYAIETANKEILNDEGFQLKGIVKEISYGNDFEASKSACKLLRQGVAAIIGPEAPSSSSHIANVCDAKDVPYIDTRWDANSRMPIVNMYPHPDAMTRMFVDIILAWGWTSFTILYETASWLPRMSDLLELYDSKGYTVTVRCIDLGLAQNNFRPVLRRVKLSDDRHIIIACSIERLPEVLKQVQQVGLMTEYHQFFIANLDAHTIDLEPFQYSGTNISTVRIVQTESAIMEKYAKYLNPNSDDENGEGMEVRETDAADEAESEEGEAAGAKAEGESQDPAEEPRGDDVNTENAPIEGAEEGTEGEADEEEAFSPDSVRTQTALIYDAVMLLAEALKQLGVDNIRPKKINCFKNELTWEKGNSISNFMRNTVIEGLSGEIRFDTGGWRTNFALEIVELDAHGIVKVGTWSTTHGVNITKAIKSESVIGDGSFKNKTFIVLTSLSPPYGMLKDSALLLTGNERFEGFGIDIIHELSMLLGFKYIFKLQEDGAYGTYNNATGEWNGMIRELRDQRADLAITDLTITSERETGADFTMPFMNLGISILYRKPTKKPPSTFSFMSPFSVDVWMYLAGACLAVSCTLFFLGRICPAEWDNPYPCIEEPTELENQFSFQNSMWFAIGALLQQGSEIAPKGASTRIVAAIWWFFTLIIVSSYTANLAAFLTIESLHTDLKSAEDLRYCGVPGHTCPVTFGAKKDGSTFNFFKEAEHETYRNMYNYMVEHPELMTKDNAQGLEWAKKQNYAFLMESSSIQYIIERHCDVTQVGDLLDEKGYGIAMRKDSDYRNALSEGVLRLQEQGRLAVLKIKWWKEKKGGGACADTGEEGGAVALGMANVEGIFYLLVMGVTLAIIIAIFDVLLETRARSKELEVTTGDQSMALSIDNIYGVFFVLFMGSVWALTYGVLEWFLLILKRSITEKVPFKEELMAEIKFLVKCEGDTKVVRRRKSGTLDSRHSIASYKSHHTRSSDEIKADANDIMIKSSKEKT